MARQHEMLDAIRRAGGPICDDCVSASASLASRQQANRIGRELLAAGVIGRATGTCSICGKSKTVSVVSGRRLPAPPVDSQNHAAAWHWEGSVQAALVAFLNDAGLEIRSAANTATKETGVDVVALDAAGHEWWITVKGYPERKQGKMTNPSTQARHWFSHAMFDVVLYRTSRSDVKIGVALPDGFTTYKRLRDKSAWLREAAAFTYFWVANDGSVEVEGPAAGPGWPPD